MWVNHHTLMRHFDRVDRAVPVPTLLFLMVIAFVPFPTGVVSAALRSPRTDANLTTAAVFYGLTSVALAVMFNVIWHYGRRHLHAAGWSTPARRRASRAPTPLAR